jgi:acyl transferase domain-containing protein
MSPRGLSNPFDEVADGMGRAEAYGCMVSDDDGV